MIVCKTRQGREYKYNTKSKRFYNDLTDKWVYNPIVKDKEVISNYKQLFHPYINLTDIVSNYQLEQRLRFVLLRYYDIVSRRSTMIREEKISLRLSNQEKEFTKYGWIDTRELYKLLGTNFSTIMRNLVRDRILVKGNVTSPKGYHDVYNFHPDIDVSLIEKKPITSGRVETIISKYYGKNNKDTQDKIKKLTQHVIENNPIINISKDQVYNIYCKRWIKKGFPNKYMINAEYAWHQIKRWNDGSYDYKLSTINSNCEFGHRFHYIYSYLPKEIRMFASHGLAWADQVNSQPAILADLLYKILKKRTPFIQAVEKGLIYEDIAQRLNLEDREEGKIFTLASMYCKPTSKLQKIFNEIYPEEDKVISQLKTPDHKDLSKRMQRRESEIWRPIWDKLIDLGYDILPLHDSVYIKDAPIDKLIKAEELIKKMLIKEFSINIKVTLEYK